LDLAKFEEAEEKEKELDGRIVGLERIEALGLGDQFTGETFLTGPFGTKDDPVIVHSYFNSRIVGCQGGPGHLAHDLLWHEVRREKPLVCLECGQFFVLQPHPLKEKTEELLRKLHDGTLPAHEAHPAGDTHKHAAGDAHKHDDHSPPPKPAAAKPAGKH